MKRLLVGFTLIFSLISAFAEDAQVVATVDRNEVAVGDVINFTITIRAKDAGQAAEPQLTAFDGFELINSSTSVETRSLFANGKFLTEQSRNFTYMLVANKKGNIILPAVDVIVDGKSYRTQPIRMAVSEARTAPPNARNRRQMPDPFGQDEDAEEDLFNQILRRRFDQAFPGQPQMPSQPGRPVQPFSPPEDFNPNEAFFITAEVDKNKAFVGEQITTTFYLYTRGQIRDIDTLKYPDLKGFWKEDLDLATRLNFEQVNLNGLAYQRALLVSYALFPIKAGQSSIDPYKAKCTVLTPSTFGFGHAYQFTKASKPITIQVMDVPVQGRPANYTGAVGNFKVSAQFEPTTGVVNQPVTLRVRFEGRGNAKLIELPKLDLPPSFEVYDQKSQAKYMKDGMSFKEFEVLILPREPGVFQIPPISIAEFDPVAKKFANVATNALSLTVTGTALPQQAQTPGAKAPNPSPTPSGPTLPPLASELAADPVSRSQLGFTVLLYLAVIVFLAQQAWVGFRRKPKRVSLSLVLKRRLKLVQELAAKKEWRRMGVELTNTAYSILGQLSDQGGASQELKLLLEKTPPSLRNELAVPIEKLLDQCEALSFAPEALIGEMTEKAKLDKLIADFEKTMSRAIELAEI